MSYSVDYTSSFRDEEYNEGVRQQVPVYEEDAYKTPKERFRDHATFDLGQNPGTSYGLGGMRNYIPFAKSPEEQAREKKKRYSRGYLRKGTYIILPKTADKPNRRYG